MSLRRIFFILLVAIALIAMAGIQTKTQQQGQDIIAGRNVNMVSGQELPGGDPYLQRQNEPSMAVSTRNPLHLLAAANDYRTVEMPGIPEDKLPGPPGNSTAGDAWMGIFRSFDGGESWTTELLPGFPQENPSSEIGDSLQTAGQFGLNVAADPVVRAGVDGQFFISGIAFYRDPVTKAYGDSALFVARYRDIIDEDGVDRIVYEGTSILWPIQEQPFFTDKPWMAVDIPRGNTFGNVYIVYSLFSPDVSGNLMSEIHIKYSNNGGGSWSDHMVLASAPMPTSFTMAKQKETKGIYQGSTIAIDPEDGTVYVAWRQFGQQQGNNIKDAIYVIKSTYGGSTFNEPVKIANIDPFDQGTSPATFRTNSYPTMVVDDQGRIYVAWSQREEEEKSRIVISTSEDGIQWKGYKPIEGGEARGHKFMPSMTYAGGKLMVAWYDQRNDISQRFTEYMDDRTGEFRHTIDVRVAQADPGKNPKFEPSIQVSRYLFVLAEDGNSLYQAQFNVTGWPIFKGGTTPFIGDYIDICPSPRFVWDGSHWQYNTDPADIPVFHVVWTDNRDVRPPIDNDWSTGDVWRVYTPPGPEGEACNYDVRLTGVRNQNIYTSRISQGLQVGSPRNSKRLNSTYPFPRAFAINVNNSTDEIKSFRLSIPYPVLVGGQASFLQFKLLDELDVSVAPYSSISRPVFVGSSVSDASVRINVNEIGYPGGDIVAGGLSSSVVLNPGGAWEDDPPPTEEFDPIIVFEEIVDWKDHPELNANIFNANIFNPSQYDANIFNTDIVNHNVLFQSLAAANIFNPTVAANIFNANIFNANIFNANIFNASLTGADLIDVVWLVTNGGTTTATYTFKTFANESLPEGIYVQLLIYKTNYTPGTDGLTCELNEQPHDTLLANIFNANIFNTNLSNANIFNANIFNAGIENATFSVPPGDEIRVVLRLVDPEPLALKIMQDGQIFDIREFANNQVGGAVTGMMANTGETTPRAAATKLLIGTGYLADGIVDYDYGNPSINYNDTTLKAVGGTLPYSWSIISGQLPPGLDLYTGSGRIFGFPTQPGTYAFFAQVSDNSGQTDIQRFTITINLTADPGFLTITTTTLPSGVYYDPYAATLIAEGGQKPYTWSLVSGSLPVGLGFYEHGVISGTPKATGTFNLTVQVEDDLGAKDTQALSLEINESGTYVTISGTVQVGASGLPGVFMQGLPGTPTTDGNGDYSDDTVPVDWTGTVTPLLDGYTFDPPEEFYPPVTGNITTNYAAYLAGYTILGTLTYNGAPLVSAQVPAGAGNHGAHFWGYQGEGGWDFTEIYDYDTGTFTIYGVQPGDYSLSVKVDTIPPLDDFTQLPGTFRGDFDFNVPSGQPTVQISLPCQIFMHLTTPVDGSNAGPYTIPPTHSWMSPVTFTWEAVVGAQTYTYTVNKYTDGTPPENIHYGTTAQTSVSISLDPSGANDYYSFHVLARTSDEPPDQLGRLHIVWDTSITSSYFFTVETPTPAESDIYIEKDGTEIPDDGSYDFGWHRVDTDTDAIFTIQNTGTAELTFSSINLTGTNPDQFHIQQQPSSIPAGQSDSLIVRFTPTSDHAKTALLTIENNDPDDEGQYAITLNGTGYGSESYIMFLSTFDEDTAGNPPEAGGAPDQPTNLQVPSGGSILVQSAANGLATQPVEISDGGTQAYGSVDYSFSPFSSGILYIEATIAIGDRPEGRASGLLLQTYDAVGPVTSLSMSHVDGMIRAAGIPIGSYTPDKPFRIYQTVNMDTKKWSVVMDDEMNGFDDDTMFGDLDFVRPAHLIFNVSEVRASLDVEDSFSGETRVSYDDIFIGEGAVYPSGMVTYWKFDEGDGNIAVDTMATANGAVYGATWTAGQVGGALNFDGSDDYVDVGIHDFLNYVNDFSYSVWIRPSVDIADGGTGRSMIISLHGGPFLTFELADGTLNSWLFIGQEQYLETNKAVWDQDTWYHIGVTFDESEWKIYVNGELDNERSGGVKNAVGDNFHIKIGRVHLLEQWYFNGLMDEFAIFNRALSPAEIQRHYLNGLLGRGYEEPGETFNVSGHVYYSTTALDGVTVELIEGDISGPVVQTTTTDGSGYYKFSNVRLGPYNVKVYKPAGDPDFIDWKASSVTVTDGDATRDLDLPKKLTLLTPLSGSDVSDTTPELTWQANPKASKYTVQLNVTSPWTLVEQTPNITTTNYTVQTTLTVGENYSWQVDAYDSANHHVGTTQTAFTFTVVTLPPSPPTVTSFEPADDASDVPLDTNLEITFSEDIVANIGHIIIYKSDDSIFETIDVTDGSRVTVNSNIVTIDPEYTFGSLTSYYVKIDDNCFKDTTGIHYAGISDKTTWNFTTVFVDVGNLVAYLPFNGNAHDESGNANHGTIHGSASFTQDRFGNPDSAINFDGTDDYVELTNESDFDLTELTIVVLFKIPDYSKRNYLFSKGAEFGNYAMRIYEENNPAGHDGKIMYAHQITSGGNWTPGSPDEQVPQDKFFHVAVTLNSTMFNQYMNGELKRSVPNPTPPRLNDENVTIGKAYFSGLGDQFFLGVIDEVRIYNRVLSVTEIEQLYVQSVPITTVAGDGTAGYSGDGGPAIQASLQRPIDVVVDSAGNIFIADFFNNRIRKVDTSGDITTVAGTGTAGYSGDGGPATSAQLDHPQSVAVDSAGNIFIADSDNHRIRKVDTSGDITTVAGTGTAGYSGDGGLATSASLNRPFDVAVDSAGNVFVADFLNNRIRKVDTSGNITTVAGNGIAGYSGDGGPATLAQLNWPVDVAVDSSGNIFIVDHNNNRIRKVWTSNNISTVAGNGDLGHSGDGGPAIQASLNMPGGVAVDSTGNIFIADMGNHRIRKVGNN